MSRKREPVAVICGDDYLIVKHTHDVEQARELMAAALKVDWYGPHADVDERIARRLSRPHVTYARIINALPNSYAEAEGWSCVFQEQDVPSRGAFPAVVFH